MARGIKKNETRSWPTNYRGDLVVCAAKRKMAPEDLVLAHKYQIAINPPYGCALCVVHLKECTASEFLPTVTEQEADLGDYRPGRWIWITSNLRVLRTPIPVVGRQGLFDLPDNIITAIQSELQHL